MYLSLTNTRQLHESAMADLEFDMVVAASGYEARSTHCCEMLKIDDRHKLLVFGFKDRLTLQRERNDRFFALRGANFVEMEGNACLEVAVCIREHLDSIQKESVTMLVDYSCMTRSWYSGIMQAIRGARKKVRIECIFSYSPAKFTEPSPAFPNTIVGPLPGFSSLDVPDKPTALVVGLGYERDRALGLLEYVDPALIFVFYTDPAYDPSFRDMVVSNNAALLRQVPVDHVYRHPIQDLQRTGDLLLSLYAGLHGDYRVILAPLGIKPFSLLCMLLAARFDDVDLWRVSSGIRGMAQEREALGPILSLAAVFES